MQSIPAPNKVVSKCQHSFLLMLRVVYLPTYDQYAVVANVTFH